MKKYFCDVCGVELPIWDEEPAPKPSPTALICGWLELCPRCNDLAYEVDVSKLARAEMNRLIEAGQEEPVLPSDPAPSPKGKAAKEKRAILAAVGAYRKEHGPGSIAKLAQLAKVNESELRDMIQCVPTPIAIWRKVGKVLEVDNAGEGGANP